MKNFGFVSRISLWVVNLMFVALLLYAGYSVVEFWNLFDPKEPPSNAEWVSMGGVGLGDYELLKVTNNRLNQDGELVPKLEYYLRVPYPKILIPEVNYQAKTIADIPMMAMARKDLLDSTVYQIQSTAVVNRLGWIFALGIGLVCTVLLISLILLRKLLLGINQKDFFSSANYRYLILLSIPPFLYPLAQYILGKASISFFQANFRINGLSSSVSPDYTPLIIGMIFLLIAGMVYEGSKLKEDQDLTI